jgi:hypothetical protein
MPTFPLDGDRVGGLSMVMGERWIVNLRARGEGA